ncbi:hypothetical protein FQN54_008838 [Arachnomyces sp. PD_36]|nr:hypothetical protein FQN54_008838 [Arachnomyces sp. PD_36]
MSAQTTIPDSNNDPPRSFTRMETPTRPFVRSTSNTAPDSVNLEVVQPDPLPLPTSEESPAGADVFEKQASSDSGTDDATEDSEQLLSRSQSVPDRFDELPIELMSLTDRFIESLSAKVHSTPPSIDRLSDLFQEFYIRAGSHIATHISALASTLHRDTSPAPPRSSRSSSQSTLGLSTSSKNQKAAPKALERATTDHQMLTPEEVAERRKARKLLEYKRLALEEAVERRACESIYEKIWRHRSTLDEVQDEKLRSKTAALSLVGIGLKDLGIEIGEVNDEKEEVARELLTTARESLAKMNQEKFPLGKLSHLTAAHKAIVDTLTNILPSSSSADEILPTLIFTLITSPPEGINVISNLLFIQRFRSASKLDGEAAYCLTNLEAAISFLENVDLSTLRADEVREGPAKPLSDGSTTPLSEKQDPLRADGDRPAADLSSNPPLSSKSPDTSKQTTSTPSLSASNVPNPSSLQRPLSSLFNPPARALGAANDAVRNTADQSLKNISATLDNSFNFMFGRLREVQMKGGGLTESRRGIVPKTLDDARRLVNPPPILDGGSTDTSTDTPTKARAEDRLVGLLVGKGSLRGHNFDSLTNMGRAKRTALSPRSGDSKAQTSVTNVTATKSNLSPQPSTSTPPAAAFESMKNFGNTLNPLNHIPGMIRGFGRNTPEIQQQAVSPSPDKLKLPGSSDGKSVLSNTESEEVSISNIAPPIKRFMDAQDAGDLKVSDISELLEDYKRLAISLGTIAGKTN